MDPKERENPMAEADWRHQQRMERESKALKEIREAMENEKEIEPGWLLTMGFVNNNGDSAWDLKDYQINGGFKKWFFAKKAPGYKMIVHVMHKPQFQIHYSKKGTWMYDTYNYQRPMKYTWELMLRFFSETGRSINHD